METQENLQSNILKITAIVVGIFLIALISFALGVMVGSHKAKFSYRFGENYERNFIGPPPGPGKFLKKVDGAGLRNAHGLAGEIISIAENSLVIKDKEGKENTVNVTDKTLIKKRQGDMKVSDLKTSDKVVVIGKPGEDGVIEADFIRIFDNENFKFKMLK